VNSGTAVILTQIPLIIIGIVGLIEFFRLSKNLRHFLKECISMIELEIDSKKEETKK